MSDCRQSATLGSHDSWTQQVSTVEVPGKTPVQSDVRWPKETLSILVWHF